MGWYGKLIGAVLGAIIGRGWLGAIVGFLIGHQFDRKSAGARRNGSRGVPSRDFQLLFFRATFQVMGHVAKADGRVHDAEVAFLKSVALLFGLDEADFARIRESHLGPDKADPYTVLGINRTASNEEIKLAWRKLVRDNHPDKLMAQGLPVEFIELATQKLATINAAYDKVAKERGIN